MNTRTPTPWARIAFGIDENGGAPILVKAIRRGRRLTFSRANPEELSAPQPRAVLAACLFQRESFTRWLVAPIASPRKARTVFHSLLDIQLPFSVEDCQVALLAMGPTPDHTGTRGLVVGARRADITKRLESLSTAGFDPHLLDHEGIALWSRGLAEIPPIPGNGTARILIYSGIDRVTFVIGQGKEFMTAHTMRLWDPDAILRILKSSFPVQPEITQWIGSGPGTARPGETASHYAALMARWPGTMKVVNEPDAFLARALAARALTPGSTPCNLRTGRFLHPVLAEWNERQPYRWAIACLAAGLLLCLVNLAWQVAISHRLSLAQQTLRSLAVGITGSPRGLPVGQEVLTAKRAMEAKTRDMEPFLTASERPLQRLLNAILTAAREEGVSIETMTLGLKNGVIHGIAPKLGQGEKMARRLNGDDWTSMIERKESSPGDERVAFVIGMGRAREKK
ncbi:MAG: hypothetical protein WCI20_06435 [bacterium]